MQTNNYQVIVVSNVTHTYVIPTYICGEMQWSAVGRNKAAVVGYNAQSDFFKNHPLSGFSGIEDAVSCAVQLGNRRRRQSVQPSDDTLSERMPTDEEVEEAVGTCLTMIELDTRVTLIGFEPENIAEMLDSCPCTLSQIEADFGRYVQLSDSPLCFVSAKPQIVRLITVSTTLTQLCCYDTQSR